MLNRKLLGSTVSRRFEELGASTIPYTISSPSTSTWTTIIPDVPINGLNGDSLYVLLYAYGIFYWGRRLNTLVSDEQDGFNFRLTSSSTTYPLYAGVMNVYGYANLYMLIFSNVSTESTTSLQIYPGTSGSQPSTSSFFCRTFAVKNHSLYVKGRSSFPGETSTGDTTINVEKNSHVVGGIMAINDMNARFSDPKLSANYIDDFRSTELALLSIYQPENNETLSAELNPDPEGYVSNIYEFRPTGG